MTNPSSVCPTLLDAIGNTPLVEIRRLSPNPKIRILTKLEYMNPGGSIKDRAARERKDFALSDQLRDELRTLGARVRDEKAP